MKDDEAPSSSTFDSLPRAETFSDQILTRLGLPFRIESWWTSDGRERHIRYAAPSGEINAVVTLRQGRLTGPSRAVLFALTVFHPGAELSLTTYERANASTFRKEAGEMLAHFRAIRFVDGLNVAGQVTEWDENRCRARVRITRSLYVRVSRGAMQKSHAFSRGDHVVFRIERWGHQQFATDLRPIEPEAKRQGSHPASQI